MIDKIRCFSLLVFMAGLGLLSACNLPVLPQSTPASSVPSGSATITPTRVLLKTATPQSSPTPTSVPIKVSQAELKGADVRLWHTWSDESRVVLDDLIKTFNETNQWGIRVTGTYIGDSQTLYEALEAGISNAEENGLPNLMIGAPEQIASLQDQGAVISDLTPYIVDAQYGMTPEERSDILEIFWNQDRGIGNFQSGLPTQRTLHVLFYNRSWAKELGFLNPPATPAEFRQQACAAAKAITDTKDKDLAGTGGWIVNNEPETVLSWMAAFGTLDMPTRPSQSYRFNTPDNQSMVEFLSLMYSGSCAWISRLDTPYDYFARRQALFYSGSLSEIALQTQVNQIDAMQDEWMVLPYPTLNESPSLIASGYSYAVLRQDDVADLAAWLTARWLNQPENQARLAKASGMLPVSAKALALMDDYGSQYPQWKSASGRLNQVLPAPGIGSWQIARLVVADSGWQIFHPKPTPDAASTLLDTLDKTLYDVLLHRP